MALTTSNVKRTDVQVFWEGLVQAPQDSARIMNTHTDDVAALRVAALTGVGAIPSWDGAADLTTAAPDSTGAVTMTYSSYGVQVRIGALDERDIPGIRTQALQKVGYSIASTIESTAMGILANAFTSETVADTKALCATDHTTATTTRSNKGTSALDSTALFAAIQAMQVWDNYQDQPNPTAQFPLLLVVHPGLFKTAFQLINSDFTSDQLQVNAAKAFNITVVSNPYLSDANDWFLIVDPMSGGPNPLHRWLRVSPQLRVGRDDDNEALTINAWYSLAVDAGPQPDGIYGASVT